MVQKVKVLKWQWATPSDSRADIRRGRRWSVAVVTSLLFAVFLATLPPLAFARPHYAVPEPPPQPLLPFPPVQITAKSAVLVDGETGQLLYGLNPHERRAPASITKIATAIVALENDTPSRVVTVDVDWWDLTDSTVMGLFRGERLSIEDLVYGLMLPSGNDAAMALGYEVAGSPTRFVQMMNERASELGLRNTHFSNPHGLDEPNHYTTAYDITMIARYAMENPDFARVVGTKRIDIVGRGVYPLRNINRFVWYYPGADGVKNGYTDDAGQTLVGSVTRNGKRVFIAVMGSNDYVGDAAAILDYYFANDARIQLTNRPLQGGNVQTLPSDPTPGRLVQPWFDLGSSRTGRVAEHLRQQ